VGQPLPGSRQSLDAAAPNRQVKQMFSAIDVAPPDPILGLTEAFKRDPSPHKVNLGVGVYKDADGKTPVLASVKAAEARILERETSKSYLPIDGDPAYGAKVRELLFGADSTLGTDGRAVTAHTPGGTGALRVAADYLSVKHAGTTVWLSDPTWANHPPVFAAAGLKLAKYPYFDPSQNALDFERTLEAISTIPARDAVLLHACCHNPSGVDLNLEQWEELGELMAARSLLPIVDFAYQGFADGLEPDAMGLRAFCQKVPELLICSSFSKNFGLYNERTGALTVVAATAAAARAVQSHVKVVVRRNYSNPPSHGGSIVLTILNDAELRSQWEGEVTAMRDRINGVRKLFVDTLQAQGVQRDFSYLIRQRGMFSFSGLNPEQVRALREQHSVYIVDSGRINVAGMTPQNVPRLCEAIQSVL
jgi:aspartate/tyrosine/aromatic aminotransferase